MNNALTQITQTGLFGTEVYKKVVRNSEAKFARLLSKKEENTMASILEWERQAERARGRWACISAKTQREKKPRFQKQSFHSVDVFQNVTQIAPKYERKAPISAGRDAGQCVQTFSKRSRQRMLSKARKMNRDGLPLPYFVTLTYQHNMKDFKRAKKDLNAFFQRFRRVNSDFRYFWKMEPQKRGAIHFHLAWFEPSGFFPNAWGNYAEKFPGADVCLEYVRMRISSAWNEVTRQDEGFECVRSKNGKVFGNMALYAGTNVRSVENWRMFVGYVGKYMKKEVDNNPWDSARKIIKRHQLTNFKGFNNDRKIAGVSFMENGKEKIHYSSGKSKKGVKAVKATEINRVRFSHTEWFELPLESMVFREIKHKTGALNTGRWWGFSRNFDFTAIQSGAVDSTELKSLNEFCNTLNDLTNLSIIKQLIKNAERAKKERTGESLERRLTHLRNMYRAQKRRYLINKDKISLGYSLQFEINEKEALKCMKYLKYQKFRECPLLIHWYRDCNE